MNANDRKTYDVAMQVLDGLQALDRKHRDDQEAIYAAHLAYMTLWELGDDHSMTASQRAGYVRLAIRVEKEMSVADETRFTMYDYMDGVVNARRNVDVGKLLKLGPGDFAEAMAWLAADKRETYEDREHVQPELELDVYED